MHQQTNDRVTLVDEHDNVIGEMDKFEAHRSGGRLHRAISVFLFRKNAEGEKELLIQKRSPQKIVGAGQWANTVCGNVWPGESYEECVRRRLAGELGIADYKLWLKDIYSFIYQVQCNQEFSEHELDHVFVGQWSEDNGGVQPNPAEVSEIAWVRWSDVRSDDWRERSERDWAPWFEIMMKDGELVGKLGEK